MSSDIAPQSPASAAKALQGLSGRVRLPGDKSISHRALILGASATGTTEISGLLEGADVLATADAMRALGAYVERADGLYHVTGVGPAGFKTPTAPLDFGNAGTGVRLVMGLVAGSGIAAKCIGDASLSTRPMGRVMRPLERMGAQFKAAANDTLPVELMPAPLMPADITPDVVSAQVK